MRLTRPNVSRLTLPEGRSEVIVFDDALKGFGIRVRAGGKRTWLVQYRIGAKQRRVTLGTVEAIDPDEARRRARDALAKVQLGGDPQTEKAEGKARASVTLGAVADLYLDRYASKRLRERSLVEVRRYLKTHWAPLREVALHKIGRAAVAARLAEIARDNGATAANRARATLSALFAWAMREGVADLNPVIGTNRPGEEVRRDRVLSDEELAAIWRACREDGHGRIVRLLLLTGQRAGEVGGMAWGELDLDGARWSLPAGRTKNGLAHEVPLPGMAVRALAAIPRREGRGLVFGEGEGRGFQGWSRAKAALDARLAEAAATGGAKVAPWRLHDLRRTVATVMADRLGVLPHIVEAVLNHISGHKAGVSGVYNLAVYRAEKRDALERWAEHCGALVRGGRGRSWRCVTASGARLEGVHTGRLPRNADRRHAGGGAVDARPDRGNADQGGGV